jgi:nucleoid DNA-binding protein
MVFPMLTTDLYKKVIDDFPQFKQKIVIDAVKIIFETITEAIVDRSYVIFRDFGTFEVIEHIMPKENFKTFNLNNRGETYFKVKFSPSKSLTERVNKNV